MAATMGPEKALSSYRTLLERVLQKVRSFAGVELRYSPSDAERDFSEIIPKNWTLAPQGEGDLGERLTKAFSENFNRGAQRVAIIGSDCPYLEKKDIQNAFGSLMANDLVLGPATDGGYWLVGLKAAHPELFENISWSSADVLGITLKRGRELKLKMDLLRILSDVDTEADWKAFQESEKAKT